MGLRESRAWGTRVGVGAASLGTARERAIVRPHALPLAGAGAAPVTPRPTMCPALGNILGPRCQTWPCSAALSETWGSSLGSTLPSERWRRRRACRASLQSLELWLTGMGWEQVTFAPEVLTVQCKSWWERGGPMSECLLFGDHRNRGFGGESARCLRTEVSHGLAQCSSLPGTPLGVPRMAWRSY